MATAAVRHAHRGTSPRRRAGASPSLPVPRAGSACAGL